MSSLVCHVANERKNRVEPAVANEQKKLHPCIETLNSRNLGLAKDSFKVSFGFRTLSRPRLIKDPKNEKPLVLLCVRSKILKNHWLYCVFAQKG